MNKREEQKIQASEARQRFFELLEKIEQSRDSLIIERKGHPVAVLEGYLAHRQLHPTLENSETTTELFKRIRRFQKKIRQSRGKPPATDSVTLLRAIREES